jgi:hypothetical protein
MFLRFLLVVLVACPLGVAACGDDHAGAPGDVIYQGGTTDEAWVSMDEAPDIVGDADAPMLVDPSGPVPRTAPVTFTWTPGAVARVERGGVRFREELAALFWGPARAQAHGDPYTGPMYRVILEVPGGEVVRVLSATTSWTPDAAAWARLTGGGSPLTVEIAAAYARVNRVEEGPYVRTNPATVELE